MRFICILLLLFSVTVSAQKITVFDADTREPIPGVAIYNQDKSKSALTDFDGKADITAFSDDELIIFITLKKPVISIILRSSRVQ